MKAVRPLWNAELTSRIDAEAAGKLENQAGYYKELTGGLDWGPGDLCWVISNSGRNTLVVELALEARRHGVTVVGLVSREHSGIVSAAPGRATCIARTNSRPPGASTLAISCTTLIGDSLPRFGFLYCSGSGRFFSMSGRCAA